MRRNCSLELRLMPSSLSFPAKDCHLQQLPKLGVMKEGTTKEGQQQLTIFYNGKVVAYDLTELQARAIIMLASQEKSKTTTMTTFSEQSPPPLQSQACSGSGLSMKRSLKQFLQKRKNRARATSPYQSYNH